MELLFNDVPSIVMAMIRVGEKYKVAWVKLRGVAEAGQLGMRPVSLTLISAGETVE